MLIVRAVPFLNQLPLTSRLELLALTQVRHFSEGDCIIKQGDAGKLSPIIRLVTNDINEPINYLYFWITGILSAFLDNTPTYLIFFHLAGGDPENLMNNLNKTLVAISTASVFMGALTYIGNAPNFFIKSIAESSNINMPSFIGYLFCATCILGPLLYLISILFT